NVYDLNKDGKPDLVISNMQGSSSYIYWGCDGDTFGVASRTLLPTSGATGNSIADLNRDGNLDILFSNFNGDYSVIYWGSKDGFTPGDTTCLPSNGAHGNYICDLNHDGGLDIIISNWWGSESYIYWGDNKGHFEGYRRTALPTSSSYDIAVADLNKDGRLDLVFANGWDPSHNSFIYWGQSLNDSIYYSTTSRTLLNAGHAQGVSIGDINKDGWLDIALSNTLGTNDANYADTSYVYLGSSSGFSESARIKMPTLGPRGNSIVDIDRDGDPDIVFAQWFDGVTHDIPSYIYWGPDFTVAGRTELTGHGAVGPLVGKFLKNGSDMQILLTNGIQGPGFYGTTVNANTYLFNIDKDRNVTLIDSVPSVYAHLSTKDNGNVHDRGKSETYSSSLFGDGTTIYSWSNCTWAATLPAGSGLELAVHSGNSTDAEDGTWSAWETIPYSGASISSTPNAKYIQYKVITTANDYLESSAIDDISISYQPLGVTGQAEDDNQLSIKMSTTLQGVKVNYNLKSAEPVKISIYNVEGRLVNRVVDGMQEAGQHQLIWNGSSNSGAKVSSGIYVCRAEVGKKSVSQKIVYVK
ncbi:MAG: FG-GAP-like repeat-containing protein, partial [Acetobacterium sp.]|nr:FG-GAP-like repeat-containing protein [Acetobacterium sp.]